MPFKEKFILSLSSTRMQHGNHGNPNIDFAAGDEELDPPVLRHAFLGDIHLGHNLQPAEDRRLKTVELRRNRLALEHAVDPIPELHTVCLAFQVNIAGAGFDRFDENLVHQPHDRGLLGHGGVFGLVPFQFIENFDAGSIFPLRHQAVDCFGTDAQMRFDQLVQFIRGRHNRSDALSRGRADGVQRV